MSLLSNVGAEFSRFLLKMRVKFATARKRNYRVTDLRFLLIFRQCTTQDVTTTPAFSALGLPDY